MRLAPSSESRPEVHDTQPTSTERKHTMSSKFAVTVTAILAFSLLASTSQVAAAQSPPAGRSNWEFTVPSGVLAPMGPQRAAIQRGNLTAAQLMYVVRPAVALTATVGWARSRDLASPGETRLDVFAYDVGAEVRTPRLGAARALSFRPFVGLGAGARSYDHRGRDTGTAHNLAAYGSAGGELGLGRVRLRLEARDYVTGFKPLDGVGGSDARNEFVAMAGLRFVAR